MKKYLLSFLLVGLMTGLMVGSSWSANTLNPTVPKTSDPGLDITFDGVTAFDLGFPRFVAYAEYVPAAIGNKIQIRDGAATAPRVAYGEGVGGPQILYIYGATRIYVVGNQVSAGDILLLRFK
jgi:hypothetical protein